MGTKTIVIEDANAAIHEYPQLHGIQVDTIQYVWTNFMVTCSRNRQEAWGMILVNTEGSSDRQHNVGSYFSDVVDSYCLKNVLWVRKDDVLQPLTRRL
jgi:hypothetical protein